MDRNLTDQARYNRGQALGNILRDREFLAAVKDVQDDLTREMTGSKPADTSKREDLYFELIALQRVINKMAEYVADNMKVDKKNG